MPDFPALLRFDRRPLHKVWGGLRLADCISYPGEDRRIGEVWDLYDRADGDASVVLGGPLDGMSLRGLIELRGEEFLGSAELDAKGRFPLVLKLLDARQDLSVQVHPDDACAASMGLSDTGKNEAWVVLNASEDARIYKGLAEGVTVEAFYRELRESEFPIESLGCLRPKRGDAIALPAGTLHAIGKGLLVWEIQQNSDTTFRVHDWGRLGLDGQPRDLHVDRAEKATQLSASAFETPFVDENGHEVILLCPNFSVRRLRVVERLQLPSEGRFGILTAFDNTLVVRAGSEGFELERYESCVLSACAKSVEILNRDPVQAAQALWTQAGS